MIVDCVLLVEDFCAVSQTVPLSPVGLETFIGSRPGYFQRLQFDMSSMRSFLLLIHSYFSADSKGIAGLVSLVVVEEGTDGVFGRAGRRSTIFGEVALRSLADADSIAMRVHPPDIVDVVAVHLLMRETTLLRETPEVL